MWFEFVLNIEEAETTFTLLIDQIRKDRESIEISKQDYIQAKRPKKNENTLLEATKQVAAESRIFAAEERIGILAGTIFVVLNSNLQKFRSGLKINADADFGRTINGVSLIKAIRFSSNNFRHFDEWANQDPEKNQSIMALQQMGMRRPWNRNFCGEVIDAIGWADSEALIREAKGLGLLMGKYIGENFTQ